MKQPFLILLLLFLAIPGGGQDKAVPSSSKELFTVAYPVHAPVFASAKDKSPKMFLENNGVNFGEGATAILNQSTLIVRNTKEEHKLVQMVLDTVTPAAPKNLTVIVEMIEMEMSVFSDWIYSNRLKTDGRELRKQAQEWIKGGQANIVESVAVPARSGNRAKVESGDEFIFPTEGDPPELPNDTTLRGKETTAPITHHTTTAFESRLVGVTFEVDPVLGSDDYTVDLNLAPEVVKLAGYSEWPPESKEFVFKILMPTFHKMKITTQITVNAGQYGFLGTTVPEISSDPNRKSPIILNFVRVDVSQYQNDPAKGVALK